MSQSSQRPDGKARFVTGSTMRHVLVMAGAGSAGLVAIFFVDFLNLFYISLLGETTLTAAVGYASALIYLYISVAIALTIAAAALVARALGAEDRERARRLAGSATLWVLVINSATTLVSLPFIEDLLFLLGARGEALSVAARYTAIVLPTTPVFALGMAFGGLLRAVGDAKRSMYTTLLYGLVLAVLDPLLILALGLGVDGAAITAVIARFAMAAYGLWVLIAVHDLIGKPGLGTAVADLRPLAVIGLPVILTQVATPFAAGYMTSAIAPFGDEAVAGWAVISRLLPVAFGGLFALSGAVGPVMAQNLGAHAYARVRKAFSDSLLVSAVYVIVVSALLFVIQAPLARAFELSGEASELMYVFGTYLAISYFFAGGLFVSNAVFNNLGFPVYSTLFNWGRATLGTIPFAIVGADIAGADGALAGYFIGGIPFGIAAIVIAYRVIGRIEQRGAAAA